jgi:hypothetical protein
MGYAKFRNDQDGTFAPWRERLRNQLGDPRARDRLREVQHLLCQLVETLDSRRLRYTQELERA